VTQAGLTNSACPGSVSRCFTYDSLGRLATANNTESGATSYVYDDNGNLTQRVLGGVTTASSYDALNRPYLKSYAGGVATPAVTYCYDGQVFGGSDGVCTAGSAPYGIGHLTQVRTSASTSSYSAFDALGRVTVSTQATVGSPPYSFGYSYNRVGMTTESYPSGRTVTYQYDTAGRVKGLFAGTTNYAGYAVDPTKPIGYAPHGGIQSLKLGNGLEETTTYNSRFQPTNIQLSGLMTLGFTYGATPALNNGNVSSQVISGSGLSAAVTQNYTDALRVPWAQGAGVRIASRRSSRDYPATLNLIASLGAWTRSCFVPRYRSVVWTEA
jgi:YD repeat-containing protein